MEHLSNIQFNTLGRWAIGASLLHGMGVISQKKGFGVFAMPFHSYVLHEFIQPFYPKDDHGALSSAFQIISGISLLSKGVVHLSSDKERQSNKQLKAIHALNEMVILASFVTTVVAAFLAVEGKRPCTAAATMHALCYLYRFYQEAGSLHLIGGRQGSGLPEGIIDVTEMVSRKKKAYLGRDDFVDDVLGVLRSSFETNNPLLIGPAGSGKTELVHFIASEINEGKLKGFEGWKVYKTNCKELVSNTKYLGELPKKINQIFAFLKGKKAILFIDEIHQALSDGVTSHSPDSSIAEGLIMHLTDPDIRVIAATTIQHSDKLYHNEPFRQRFYFQPMPRMTQALRKKILEDRIARLKAVYKDVTIPDDFESLLIQCLTSKREQNGLRSLISLLSVTVERMTRKKINFREALQQDLDQRLELDLVALEAAGFNVPDDFIERLKAKSEKCALLGKEFFVFDEVLKEVKKNPREKNLVTHLERVPVFSD